MYYSIWHFLCRYFKEYHDATNGTVLKKNMILTFYKINYLSIM